jgi:hypothetical protein
MRHQGEGVGVGRVARCVAVGLVVLVVRVSAPLAATITVTTTSDDITPNDGSVSFREALTAINAGNDLGDPDITAQNPGLFGTNDTIAFNITGGGVRTINVGTDASAVGIPLPTIRRQVLINGYTQGGASVNTLVHGDNAVLLIQVNGTNAGLGANGLDLGTGSGSSTVRGLIINQFSGNGIAIESDGNVITGNFIGTDPTGNAAGPGNAGDGIVIAGANGNTIGTPAKVVGDRNVIAHNGMTGVDIVRQLNTIEGNVFSCNAAKKVTIPLRDVVHGNLAGHGKCSP